MTIYGDGIFGPTPAGNINQYEVVRAEQLVGAFGVANGTLVYNGIQIIGNFGTANNTVLDGLNAVQSIAGGTAYNANVIQGTQKISAGVSEGAVIRADGIQELSGGTASNTHVISGIQNITGGTADNTIIDMFGQQNVSGGVVKNNTVQNGSVQNINGGTVDSTLIRGGATQNVNSGTVNNTFVSSATQNISGGQANATRLELGTQHITGGVAKGSKLFSSSQIVFDGQANDSELYDSEQVVTASGVADNTLLRQSVQKVSAGGEVKNSRLYSSRQILGHGAIVSGSQSAENSMITFDGASILGSGSIQVSNSVLNSTVANPVIAPSFEGKADIEIGQGQKFSFSSLGGSYNIRLTDIKGLQADYIELLDYSAGLADFTVFGGNYVDVGAASYQLVSLGNSVAIKNTYAPAQYVTMLPHAATVLDTHFYRFTSRFTDHSFISYDEEERPYSIWIDGLYDQFEESDSLYDSSLYGVSFGGAYFFYLDEGKVFSSVNVKYGTSDTAFSSGESGENEILSGSFTVGYAKHDAYLLALTGAYAQAKSSNQLKSNGAYLGFDLEQSQYLVALEAARLFDFDGFCLEPGLIGSFSYRPEEEFRLNGIDGLVKAEYSAAFKGNLGVSYHDTSSFDFAYKVFLRGGLGCKTAETEIQFGGFTQESAKSGFLYDAEAGFQLSGESLNIGASVEYLVLPVGNSLAGNISFKVSF